MAGGHAGTGFGTITADGGRRRFVGMGLFGRDRSAELARIERKLDSILRHLDIDPYGDAPEDVVRLVRSGSKIAAIKEYRRMTGAGLREAKEYVDRLS
jgi:hypothetical protein